MSSISFSNNPISLEMVPIVENLKIALTEGDPVILSEGESQTMPPAKSEKVILYTQDGSSWLYRASKGYEFRDGVDLTVVGESIKCFDLFLSGTWAYCSLGPYGNKTIKVIGPNQQGGEWERVD